MEPEYHDGATSRKRRRSLPPPPAEPPAALVRLLQDDAEVRHYFSALQAHLDADIRKWKERAIALKQENKILKSSSSYQNNRKETVSTMQKPDASARTKAHNKRKSHGNAYDHRISKDNVKLINPSQLSSLNDGNEAVLEQNSIQRGSDVVAHVPIDVGVPIEDSMFDELDSEDEDDDSPLTSKRTCSTTQIDSHVHELKITSDDVPEFFPFLKEVYDIFQRLGIALVTVCNPESSNVVDKEVSRASLELSCNVEAIRTDQVMSDILRKIATNQLMVASSSSNAKSDRVDDASPAGYFAPLIDEASKQSSDHPLVEGKHLLFRAFVLIDTFCSSSVSQKEWDGFFVSPLTQDVAMEELECMKIGLRSRKQLVDHLILFLNDSIAERWVFEDQAQRLLNTRVQFEQKNEAEMGIVASDVVATKRSLFYGNILERCTLCQLATFLLLLRNDVSLSVQIILQHLVATTPHVNTEEFPKMPPLLSLAALESLFLISDPSLQQLFPIEDSRNTKSKKASDWFHRQVLKLYPQEEERDRLYDSLALVIHLSAAIWEKRLASTRDYIHDIAYIEMFSYQRLVLIEKEWLNRSDVKLMNDGEADILDWYCDKGRNICRSLFGNDRWRYSPVVDGLMSDQDIRCLSLELSFLLGGGNVVRLNQVVNDQLCSNDLALFSNGQALRFFDFLVVGANVVRHLELRRVDPSVIRNIGSAANLLVKVGDCLELWQRMLTLSTFLGTAHQLQLLLTALKCFGTLADGNAVLSLLNVLMEVIGNSIAWSEVSFVLKKSVYSHIREQRVYLVVRVINLARRKDRIQSLLQQALRERLLILKAVVDAKVDKQEDDGYEFGLHAVDGSGRLVEATDRLVLYAGSLDQLNNLVKSHWRPNDLKPFDVDAPLSETLVRTSPSEKACALSHISSWKGALRSLQCISLNFTVNDCISPVRSPSHIVRLFKISGFAKGHALLPQNNQMAPTPVCVILEDDAVLVERFRERLNAVLDELPRDFHFCSLGYGRPKSAPIVPFSEHIGVPSMLWYLTGYCVSEAGVQYLLDALPVVGPVDSWIGLKMTNNWDNIFGMKLGVGSHGKPKSSDLPSRDDLSRLLQFHAYCAVPPLCSQKVRATATASTGGAVVAPTRNGRHWRQRDTDIEYSGGDVAHPGDDG